MRTHPSIRRPGAVRVSKLRLAFSLLAAAAAASSPAGEPGAGSRPPELRVLKAGADVAVRSAFGPGFDVVLMMSTGFNCQVTFGPARLVAATSEFSLAATAGGWLLHGGADDAVLWQIHGTTLGGNRTLEAVVELDCPGHGFGPEDIGSEWTDAAGTPFHLVRVLDAVRLRFLSRDTGRNTAWAFTPSMEGRFLTGKTRAISLGHTGRRTAPWQPACRIVSQDYLADGQRALEDGLETRCGSLEIVDTHDLLNPAGLLEYVLRTRDPDPDPSNPDLPALLRNRIAYRLFPGGAVVIETEARALQSFTLDALSSLRAAPAAPVRRYAIPKTRPGTNGTALLRFDRFQELPAGPTNALYFRADSGTVANPLDLPDRVIQRLGGYGPGAPAGEIGFAQGYSLVEGLTRPAARAAQCGTALIVQPDGAVELRALDASPGQPVAEGAEFRCLAYRQYFDPAAQPRAAAVYAHPQGGSFVVYAHYHRPVDTDWIPLPPALTGRPVEIVEPSDSLSLVSGNAVTPRGVAVSVTNPAGGHAVFRVPDPWDPGVPDAHPPAR